jgi:hypothetical protein
MLFWLLAISLIEKYGQKGRWGCNVKYLTSNGKRLYITPKNIEQTFVSKVF